MIDWQSGISSGNNLELIRHKMLWTLLRVFSVLEVKSGENRNSVKNRRANHKETMMKTNIILILFEKGQNINVIIIWAHYEPVNSILTLNIAVPACKLVDFHHKINGKFLKIAEQLQIKFPLSILYQKYMKINMNRKNLFFTLPYSLT